MNISRLILLSLLFAAMQSAFSEESASRVLPLESYEPNTMGFTWDDDDVSFLDFKLSIKYPIMPERICSKLEDSRLYFAATARFAQYLGTRDSSPVLGKRFNPKLIWRQVTGWEGETPPEADCEKRKQRAASTYLDFAFGHESNGQSIDSPERYSDAQLRAEKPEYANDNISRGWDYLEIVHKSQPLDLRRDKFETYLTLKYFLNRGPLQGAAEEYNSWENNPEGKPRRSVNGVAALFKYRIGWACCNWLEDPKFAFGYETGYKDVFRYSTVRLEAGIKLWELPVTLWTQSGYNSDLALYYKKVTSYGFAMEIASF